MSDDPKRQPEAQIGRAAQDRIGRQLRAMYSELIRQPLPERLLSTLNSIRVSDQDLNQSEEQIRKAA
jgi:Anti-sigma factor NepR